MGWIRKYQPKNVKINPKNPGAIATCDESGFTFNHKDLVRQMEWRGNRLVWTGFMVAPKYLDEPQEQNRPPLVKKDPMAVETPRIPSVGQPATFDRNADQIPAADPPYSTPGVPIAPPYSELLSKLNDFHWSA